MLYFIYTLIVFAAVLWPSVSATSTPHYVTQPIGSCAGAIPDDGLDDYAEIQCHVDYLNANFGGRDLILDGGTFHVSSMAKNPGAVRFVGLGRYVTTLKAIGDITALEFSGPHHSFGGLRDMGIECLESSEASKPCVKVTDNTPVTFTDFKIWGGCNALQQFGVDGYMENGHVAGTGGTGCSHLFTRGANWYHRVKFNTRTGYSVGYGIAINTWVSGSVKTGVKQENRFTESDISGAVSQYSLIINDSGKNEAITSWVAGTIANKISILNAFVTTFGHTGFGSNVLQSSSPVALAGGNYAVGPSVVVSGSGTRSCAGNINVTC